MKAAEQFAVIDNLSKGRLYTTMSRGYHPGYWQQFGIPQEHLLGRFQEAIRIWQEAFKGERFDFDGQALAGRAGAARPAALPARRLADLGRRQRRAARRSGARPSTASA